MRHNIANLYDHDPHFNWRGEAVTRIENLSDIVFALALGMLVSATTAPSQYSDLLPHMFTIIPVTAGFAIMVMLWNIHFIYFRRYGIADQRVVWLNGILLLLILFIAYPLRFAVDSLFAFILMILGSPQRMEMLGIQSYREAGNIIALFYAGLGLAHLIYQSMYAHALKNAQALNLSATEIRLTKRSIWRNRMEIVLAIIIAPLAAFTILGPFAAILGMLSWPGAMLIRHRYRVDLKNAAQEPIDQASNP